MKKLLSVLVFAGVLSAGLDAKNSDVAGHWGILGGINTDKFSTVQEFKDLVKNEPVAGWHLGLTAKLDLPLFFSIQPSVLYENRNSTAYTKVLVPVPTQMKTHNINVPIAIQWGPDLGFIRPFVEATPYADFLLGGKVDIAQDFSQDVKDYFNTVRFGVGVGGGLEIWKIQIKVRYNWNFGTWKDVSLNPFKDWNGHQQGLTASIAFFFN